MPSLKGKHANGYECTEKNHRLNKKRGAAAPLNFLPQS